MSSPSRFGSLAGVALAIAITAVVTAALHAREHADADASPRQPLPVDTVTFSLQGDYERPVSYLGLVNAGSKARLGFEIAGTVAELPWREGSPVAAGEVIARLDDAALRSRIRAVEADQAQARAELELAQIKARRQQELRTTGAVSKEAYDESRLLAAAADARLEAVTARLQSLAIDLEKTRLHAPYAGVIGDRYLQAGAVVVPGTPVVQLLAKGAREAHIGVAVDRSGDLRIGADYTLRLRGERFGAELLSVRPDVDPVTRVTTAVFALPDAVTAVDGEAVTLELRERVPSRGGWLPVAALLEGSRGLWNVLRIDTGDGEPRALREVVEVIDIQGDRAFVRGSLPDGATVIASGTHRVTPGTRVDPIGTR